MRWKRIVKLTSLVALSFFLQSADFSLEWKPSITTGVEYIVYAHTNVINSSNFRKSAYRYQVGEGLVINLSNCPPGRWWFTSTALKDGIESDPCNILSVDVPSAPGEMNVVMIHHEGKLSDNGFFNLRIPRLPSAVNSRNIRTVVIQYGNSISNFQDIATIKVQGSDN